MNLEDFQEDVDRYEYSLADQWILSRYNSTVGEVTRLLEKYELGEAGRELYEFIWNEFCDWYIELVKPRLYGKEDLVSKRTAQKVLIEVLRGTMELLHPFMPFITEEIWQHLPHEGETIMLTKWPQVQEELVNKTIETEMALIMDIIRAIRNLRSEMNVPLGKEAEVIVAANKPEALKIIEKGQSYIKALASVSDLNLELTLNEKPQQAVTAVIQGIEVFLPLKGLVDIEKEKARLNKELSKVNQEIERLEKKLNNPGFLGKAPEEVVEKEKEKLANYKANKEALLSRVKTLE